MVEFPIKLSTEQLDDITNTAKNTSCPAAQKAIDDNIKGISTKNIGPALKQALGDNWEGVLGEIYSTMVTDSTEMDQLTTNQYFEEFKKSLGDIHKFKARVITNSRNLFSQNEDNSDQKFMEKIVTPYITRDQDIISSETNKFLTNIQNNFMTLYDIYDSNRKNISIINNVLEIKEKILFDTIANIQLYEQKNNVDVRNNLYQFERIELYNNIFNTLKIIYFSLLIIYIIFGNFMKEEMYKKKYFYIIAIVYIALPFMLKYIFAGIIFVYEYIQSLLGNNKQVLTYNDIVRANNIDNIYTSPVPDIRDRTDVIRAYSTFVRNPRNQNLPFVNSTAQSLS